MTVGLYGYSTNPPENTFRLDNRRQQVTLHRSPAIADFQIACLPDTKSGDIKIAAVIDEAPRDFKIVDANPPEAGLVRILIDKESKH